MTILQNNFRTAFTVILTSFVLIACGGGGGGETAATSTSPVFTSGTTISVNENTTATGYTAAATDADGDTITYSVTGGTDQTVFSIDTNSGILSFLTAPDFELPTDSDTNNTYVVGITASDGTNLVNQSVTITVIDIANETQSQTTFTLGGTVTGLTGTLVLKNTSNGESISLSGDGAYSMTQTLANGGAYDVSILTQPTSLSCVLSNGNNTINSANVTNIDIICASRNLSFIDFGIATESPSIVTSAFRILDASNNPISGLTANDFQVLEDGAVVTQAESFKDLEPVGAIPYTFNTVIALDISASLSVADIQQVKV